VPYNCNAIEYFYNKKVGDGTDVAFVTVAANTPPSSVWREGDRVQHNHRVTRGTAIATFQNGAFYDSATGTWAAIFLSQDGMGLRVLVQEHGFPVHEETIPWHSSMTDSNSADKFHVIE